MFNSIEEIRAANVSAGCFFFSQGALRFFDSRIGWEVYPVVEGAYFVTSERFDYWDDRLYTVRFAFDSGHVVDASKFQEFKSQEAAHKEARRLAEGGFPPRVEGFTS